MMNRLKLLVVLLGASNAGFGQILPADSPERIRILQEEARNLFDDLTAIREKVFHNLPPSEADIVRTIQVEPPVPKDDDISNCYAGRSQKGPFVVIGLGFARSLRMFLDAQLMAAAMNRPELGTRYVEYVIGKWQENMRNRNAGLPPIAIESPYTYMDAPREIRDAIQDASQRAYGAALAFALAHEVGHHIRGHVDNSGTSASSIEREEEADAWAIKTLIVAGEAPSAGLMPIAYFAALYETEGARSTHPTPKDRARVMIAATLNNLDSYAEQAKANGVSLASVRSKLEASLAAMNTAGDGLDPQMSDAVRSVYAAAEDGFGDFRGEVTDRSDGDISYASTFSLPKFDDCIVYRWKGGATSFSCTAKVEDKDDAEELFKFVIQQTCTTLRQEGACVEQEPTRSDGIRKITFKSRSGELAIVMNLQRDGRRGYKVSLQAIP